MTDRRYNEDEVAAIFLKAAENPEGQPAAISRSEGLTLADLQEIGREVGIPAEAIVLAARSLDVDARTPSTTMLGLPISVERTVELNRWLSDAEWERLVVQLREVFSAKGRMSASGSFRQWTNGNLQALLEPSTNGHRLRLRTLKGSARGSIGLGLALIGASVAVAIAGAVGGHLGSSMPGVALLSVMGLGAAAYGALPLPRWARLRGRQMDAIAAGLLTLPSGPQPTPTLPLPSD
jgi:hypothetical protein